MERGTTLCLRCGTWHLVWLGETQASWERNSLEGRQTTLQKLYFLTLFFFYFFVIQLVLTWNPLILFYLYHRFMLPSAKPSCYKTLPQSSSLEFFHNYWGSCVWLFGLTPQDPPRCILLSPNHAMDLITHVHIVFSEKHSASHGTGCYPTASLSNIRGWLFELQKTSLKVTPLVCLSVYLLDSRASYKKSGWAATEK